MFAFRAALVLLLGIVPSRSQTSETSAEAVFANGAGEIFGAVLQCGLPEADVMAASRSAIYRARQLARSRDEERRAQVTFEHAVSRGAEQAEVGGPTACEAAIRRFRDL